MQVFPFAEEQLELTVKFLGERQEEERKREYEIRKAQEQQAKEVQDNMSLKIMRAIDEFDKKTKLKIDKEVAKLKELQQGMEKRLKGSFEKQNSIMVETNRKLQRQIT